MDLPAGVESFDAENAVSSAIGNIIMDVSGAPKTGKSHFGCHADRPLYIIGTDPNSNLDSLLLKADQDLKRQGRPTEPVFKQVTKPTPYPLLTRDRAIEIVAASDTFADWARAQHNGGTFLVDGALYLKGYFEKAILGESATLGFRAAKGGTGPSPIQYGQSNTAFKDFIASFVDSDLDVVVTWEGREIWKETWEDGKKQRNPTGKYKSSSPMQMGYVTNVYLETMFVLEPIIGPTVDGIVGKEIGTKVKPRIRIGPNGYEPELIDKLVSVESPQELKRLLFRWLPDADKAAQAEAFGQFDDKPMQRVNADVE